MPILHQLENNVLLIYLRTRLGFLEIFFFYRQLEGMLHVALGTGLKVLKLAAKEPMKEVVDGISANIVSFTFKLMYQ